MRTLIVTEFVSLDGVMQAPGGEPGYAHTGWVAPRFTDELMAYKLEEQLAAETLVLGRITYESFVGAWPEREGPMADKINTMDKVVVSTTLGGSEWTNTTVVSSVDAVRSLRAGAGGPILVIGSRTLVHALLAEGLVDELHLQVMPLVLGSGDRLFPGSPTTTPLELVEAVTLPGGVQLQTYRLSNG